MSDSKSSLSPELLRAILNLTEPPKDPVSGKPQEVEMYLHPDGWLFKEKYLQGPIPRNIPKADLDRINTCVKFTNSDAGLHPSLKVDDPNPLTGIIRRYEGEWGMVSGEPQVWTEDSTCSIWPGIVNFVEELTQIQQSEAVVEELKAKEHPKPCVLCKKPLTRERIYRFAHYQWDNTYLDHYIADHQILPSAGFYEAIRDLTGEELYAYARSQFEIECAEARNELTKILIIKDKVPELGMTPDDAAKVMRYVLPPVFFFRATIYTDDEKKKGVEVNRDQLVEHCRVINDGARQFLKDPVKWKQVVNAGVADPAEIRDFAATVTNLDPAAKAEILAMHKNGPARLEALLKQFESRKKAFNAPNSSAAKPPAKK